MAAEWILCRKSTSGHYKTVTSSDGMEILVGGKDKNNDYQTFKVAAAQIVGCMWPTQFRGACNCA